MTTEGPLEDGTPPVAENSAGVPDVTLVVDASTPAVAAEDDLPVPEEDTPVAADDTPPVAEDLTLPVAEEAMPLVTDENTPLAEEGTPRVVEEGTPPVVEEEGTPRVVEEGTPPVVEEEGTPPVEVGAPRTSAHRGLSFATVARRLRTFVAYVLLLAVLGAAGVCAFALVQGTWVVTPILSGSMRPGLAVGGAVISQRVPVDSLHVRDVIVFSDPYKPSEQIVHRIVRITRNKSGQLQFNTQGDANMVRDPWTLTIKGDYIYRVRWSVPLLGYVANSYQNHRGDYLLGAGIVLILIAVTTVLETRPGRRRRHARRASQAS
jgi:signal peptidase I